MLSQWPYRFWAIYSTAPKIGSQPVQVPEKTKYQHCFPVLEKVVGPMFWAIHRTAPKIGSQPVKFPGKHSISTVFQCWKKFSGRGLYRGFGYIQDSTWIWESNVVNTENVNFSVLEKCWEKYKGRWPLFHRIIGCIVTGPVIPGKHWHFRQKVLCQWFSD